MFTYTLFSGGCLLAVSLAAIAGPLDKSKISSDAKWIVHVDVDRLRQSALGAYVLEDFVNPALEGAEELKHANVSINITNISGITAYGPSFEKGPEGVLMISTTADIKKDLDSVAGMFYLNAGTNSPFIMVEKDPRPLYSFAKTVFFAPGKDTLFVAKSKEQIERAQNIVQGKGENLAKSSTFKSFKEPPNSFFSVAMAEGVLGNAAMPPQAQILRETTGGRLCLGEKDQNVFVNLVFQGKDDMATTRIQQVLQGILALVSLSQQDEEITRLAGATKISSDDRDVVINLQYPIERTIEKIRETKNEKPRAHRPHKSKAKSKKTTEPVPDEPNEQEKPPSAEIEAKPAPAK
jgi:hypothetical protein